MPDRNNNCGRKSMRVFNDCIADPVWQKEGYCDNTCRDYSPERPENLEPRKMWDVGTYEYSKLQLPNAATNMSGANEGYNANPPMTARASGSGSSTSNQGNQPAQSQQSGSAYLSSSIHKQQGEERTSYGTFPQP